MTFSSCRGPVRISRRQVLQVGAIGAFGLTLPRLLASRAVGQAAGLPNSRQAGGLPHASADHCILIFLNGGPSHLDMWDMKPSAPVEIRGEFRPIATSLTG